MSFSYFNKLNYTLANEDTGMELGIFRDGCPHIMSVAGSGGRVLPLLAKKPERVTCVDLSQEQLHLSELRFQAALTLSHAEFLGFWGYPPFAAEPGERKRMFASLALTRPTRDFFESLFAGINWESVLYLGRWERTFGKLSAVNRKIVGEKGLGLFSALTRSEHEAYLREHFPHKSWSVAVGILGNASVFNSLLYKGHFPKKNIPGSHFSFYKGAFERLFGQGPARRNFFLQMMFFGKVVFAEGCTIECDPEVFAAAKEALKTAKIDYVLGSVVDAARDASQPIDALSLSDVPSYFSGTTEKEFMQRFKPKIARDGLVVIRSYLRVPAGTDLAGYEDATASFLGPISAEKTQMYKVDIYRRK